MMTDMKTVLCTEESRASPSDPDGLTEGCVLNGGNCAAGIPRQQSGPVVMIWTGMIRNKLTDGLFRVREQLKLSADKYCSFPNKSIEP